MRLSKVLTFFGGDNALVDKVRLISDEQNVSWVAMISRLTEPIRNLFKASSIFDGIHDNYAMRSSVVLGDDRAESVLSCLQSSACRVLVS
jgi:hypothetical protein